MRVNILGFGVMGRQISALLEGLGHEVTVWCRRPSEELTSRYAREKKLFLKKIPPQKTGGSVSLTAEIEKLHPCLTIEAVIEDLEIKKKIVGRLPYGFEEFEFFTNSSSYAPCEIRPGARALHFFNPIHSLLIAEMTATAEELSPQGRELVESIRTAGIEIVITRNNRGYIGNYILFQEISAAFKLVDRFRYPSKSIDAVMSRMGRTVSIFDIVDLVGIDVVKKILENLKESDHSVYISPVLDEALKRDILGRKNRTSIRELIDKA